METLRGEHFISSLDSTYEEYHKEYQRKRRRQHKELNLCSECSVVAENGKSRCRKHLDATARRGKANTDWKIQNGYCVKNGCWEKPERTQRCEFHRLANLVTVRLRKPRKVKN